MPLPTPKAGEEQKAYVSRCVAFQMGHEKTKPKDKRRPVNQVAAMCNERYRQRGKSIEEMTKELKKRVLILRLGEDHNKCP